MDSIELLVCTENISGIVRDVSECDVLSNPHLLETVEISLFVSKWPKILI